MVSGNRRRGTHLGGLNAGRISLGHLVWRHVGIDIDLTSDTERELH